MFKIVVDATCVSDKPSGIGCYAINLLSGLYDLKSEYNFDLKITYQPGFRKFIRGNWQVPSQLSTYKSVCKLQIPGRISNLFYDYFPDQFANYLENRLNKPNLVHGTNYYIFPFKEAKKVITIHDITLLKFPDYIDGVVKQYYKRIAKCLDWADLIITVSESSKEDIVDYLNVSPKKIKVIPLASRFSSICTPKKADHSFSLEEYQPFLLFVGNIEPRKNIIGIIKAFNFLKKEYKIDHKLVIVGQKGWKYTNTLNAMKESNWHHQIYHLDYVSDSELLELYKKASLLVYPSFYEGFGLPVVEAMTLGTPVVTSNNSALAEIAKEGALLVNPNNYLDLAHSILEVITHNGLRNHLIEKGQIRAKDFSWERTAKQTIETYLSLL